MKVVPALSLLVFLLHASSAHAQDMPSEDRIRAVRTASNEALASGDVDAFMSSIDEDYVGTAGNGGHIRSRQALRELIEGVAASPSGLHFVRTATEIDVAAAAGRAIENGEWVGYTRAGGVPQATDRGRYTAYWRRVDGRWLIHAEVFVTLGGG